MAADAAARTAALSFLLGLSFGIFVAYTIIRSFNQYHEPSPTRKKLFLRDGTKIDDFTNENDVQMEDTGKRMSQTYNGLQPRNLTASLNSTNARHFRNEKLHKRLKKIRVLCWIMMDRNVKKPLKHIQDTWGKRCDVLLFMSSKKGAIYPVIRLNVSKGQSTLWHEIRTAWQYVFDHHLNDAEWFLKADDTTYVIMENLKHFCSKFDPQKPYYFGRHLTALGGFLSGDAGYVFSKETLRRFAKLLRDPRQCPLRSTVADVAVGRCLTKGGIKPGDSRDSRKRETFHPFSPEYLLIPGMIPKDSWFYLDNKYRAMEGVGCCSDYSITFHLQKPNKMYIMEYFVYQLNPYGRYGSIGEELHWHVEDK